MIGAELYGEIGPHNKPFPSLESLFFFCMSKWEDWEHPSSSSSSLEPYPRLLQLTIFNCPILIKTLPSYLPSLAFVHITDCPRLELSAATRLPSLSELRVTKCNEAVLRSEIAAPSLTNLIISRMVELTRLHKGFTRLLSGLRWLQIYNCNELRCLWENRYGPEVFDGIDQPLQLRSNRPHGPPRLRLVSLGLGEKEKQELLLPSKLESFAIWGAENLEKFPNGLHMLTSLTELNIIGCPKLVSLSESGFRPMLRSFLISDCKGLRCLPDKVMMMMKNGSGSTSTDTDDLYLLESLEIKNCPSLICFPKGQLPTTLKRLIIFGCPNLQSLPEGILMMHHNSNSITTNHLEYLSVRRCSSLTGFPEGELPTTLNDLHIEDCKELKSLPVGKFPSTLKRLKISGCAQVESISVLYNLRELRINNCETLELLLPCHLHNFRALTLLIITDCQNIKTPLSQGGLPTLTSLKELPLGGIFQEVASFSDDHNLPLLPTSLVSLFIKDFQNLESLSPFAIQSLTSLEMLKIEQCPELQYHSAREKGCLTCFHDYISETAHSWKKGAHIRQDKIGPTLPTFPMCK